MAKRTASSITKPDSPIRMDSDNSSADLQLLINALQNKFSKKSKDQQSRFETELKRVVEQTVETLSSRIASYETHLTQQLKTLEKDLGKISKDRQAQVADYEKQYGSLKKALEACLDKITDLDVEYNKKIEDFFSTMNDYRKKAKHDKENIKELVAEVHQPAKSAKKLKST